MLKKEKPMMTVAAIIEQAQNRWMDQQTLQVYNRAFQGSYCKYFIILLIVILSHFYVIIHSIHCPFFWKVPWTFLGLVGYRFDVLLMENVCNPIIIITCACECAHDYNFFFIYISQWHNVLFVGWSLSGVLNSIHKREIKYIYIFFFTVYLFFSKP